MPGARLKSFRKGDNAESLAEYILGRMAFVTPVPREEDVGHDLLCTLNEREGNLLKAGPFFAVQVKANHDPIVYEKPHELEWIRNQENPFLICVAKSSAASIEVYSAWKTLKSVLKRKAERITLMLEGVATGETDIVYADDNSNVDIYLGKPIIRVTSAEIADDAIAQELENVLRGWVKLDRGNIVRCASKMYWVLGPTEYDTNQTIDMKSVEISFYSNPENLNHCVDNFFRSCVALLMVMARQSALTPEGDQIRSSLINLIQQNRRAFSTQQKAILTKFLELELD